MMSRKGIEGIGTAVLVVEIVSVFPDVECQDRSESVGHGIGCIGCLGDVEFPFHVARQPYPARTEHFDSGFDKLLLEIFKRTEIAVYASRSLP